MDKPDPRPKLAASPVALAGGKRRRVAAAPNPDDTADVRVARLVSSGIWQTLRLPAEFHLPGTEARIWRDGSRLIVEPLAPAAPEGDGHRGPSPGPLPGPTSVGLRSPGLRPKKLRP